jgi:hypothetical protein
MPADSDVGEYGKVETVMNPDAALAAWEDPNQQLD